MGCHLLLKGSFWPRDRSLVSCLAGDSLPQSHKATGPSMPDFNKVSGWLSLWMSYLYIYQPNVHVGLITQLTSASWELASRPQSLLKGGLSLCFFQLIPHPDPNGWDHEWTSTPTKTVTCSLLRLCSKRHGNHSPESVDFGLQMFCLACTMFKEIELPTLKNRRFHIKIQISGFSLRNGRIR